jgi:RND superfamily putative drug exporter
MPNQNAPTKSPRGRWTSVLTRHARAVLAVGVLLVIGAAAYGLAIGGGVFGHLGQGGFDDPATDSARELQVEQRVFGNQNVDLVAIYRSDRLTVDDPQFRHDVERTLAQVPRGSTTAMATYWSTKDPALVSTDRHATQVLVSLAGADQAATAKINDEVMPALHSDTLDTRIGGPWAVYKGVNETVSADLSHAELRSMPLVILLSLLIFGSVVAAFMPGIIGAIAVIGGLAVVRLLTTFTEVSVFSINVISLLGMGLAIDYALFVISRYREELAKLPTGDPAAPATALRVTLATAGRTVLFSGLTVAAAMSSLLVFPQNFLRSLGYGGIAAVLIAVLAALTILPAILLLLGRRIDAGRMRWPGRRARARRGDRAVGIDGDTGAWARLAHGVMRRPVVVVVVIVVGLLAIASPFLGVTWGSVDYRVLPPDAPAHQAAVALNHEFGGERSTANILVPTTDTTALASYRSALGDVDGVLGVQQVRQDRAEDVTLLRAAWSGNSQAQHSQDLLRTLRAVPAPDGTLIGGMTADTVDLGRSIRHHLPWMAGIIVAVMLVLLFLAFGSVVLPIKAVVMNLLSLGASFGVVTWIFADGHLEDLLGYTSTGFLDMTQPIFMLAILVGLSMDYEVFLLSRVREQWDRTHDTVPDESLRNGLAVAAGVQRTGRIITSAALLLGVVIGAFSMSGVVFMKMIGVGMLVALIIDATIVRALLVPATMRLLGHWNWWAPGPLVRLWERYGVREEPAPPAAETDPDQPFRRRLQDAVR